MKPRIQSVIQSLKHTTVSFVHSTDKHKQANSPTVKGQEIEAMKPSCNQ